MSQMQKFTIGYESGSGGYNTMSYLDIKPNNPHNEIEIVLMLDDGTSFNKSVSKNTVIETNADDKEYPFMILKINNEQIHRQKYYYKNISIVITGDCSVEKKMVMDYDR